MFSHGPEVIKHFFMLNATKHEICMLINVKLSTFVGILTFMSITDIAFERLKAKQSFLIFAPLLTFISQHFSFHEQIKFHAQLS